MVATLPAETNVAVSRAKRSYESFPGGFPDALRQLFNVPAPRILVAMRQTTGVTFRVYGGDDLGMRATTSSGGGAAPVVAEIYTFAADAIKCPVYNASGALYVNLLANAVDPDCWSTPTKRATGSNRYGFFVTSAHRGVVGSEAPVPEPFTQAHMLRCSTPNPMISYDIGDGVALTNSSLPGVPSVAVVAVFPVTVHRAAGATEELTVRILRGGQWFHRSQPMGCQSLRVCLSAGWGWRLSLLRRHGQGIQWPMAPHAGNAV